MPIGAGRGSSLRRLALTLVLGAGVAQPASADWTLTAYLGGARTQDSSLTLTRPGTSVTLSPVRYRSDSFESPPYYGYRLGYFPGSRRFGIEGELIHLKVTADTTRPTTVEGRLDGRPVSGAQPLGSVVERFAITHGVNLLLVNAVARRAGGVDAGRGVSRWMVTGRVGAGASIPHPESTVGGEAFERYEWGAFSLQAGAGVEVRVAGPLYVTGEYKLTRTVQDVAIARGSARTPLVTHHLVTGLALHFPSP